MKTLMTAVGVLCMSPLVFAQVGADFSGTPTSGCGPLVVQFNDLSTGLVSSWLWDFGNGDTSTLQNPSTVFAPGTYTVTLTVSDGSNMDTETRSDYITVFVGPTASFSATPVGFTVNFTNTSTPGDAMLSSRNWDFGDGNTSTATNPTHTYAASGTYAVSLLVFDTNGCGDTLVMNVMIADPAPDITVSVGSNGDLLVESQASTAEVLTIQADVGSGFFVIRDASLRLGTSIAGATGDGTGTLTIPFVSVSGSVIRIDTGDGDDRVALDFSLGSFPTAITSIELDGGAGTDWLELSGASAARILYTGTAPGSGSIALPGEPNIVFSALE